ncbi:hypothetical protein Goari_011495 [Gossypium aridum]|uniref:Uncharacterized protein n=1 Tax=Gossypium aridum TaxID=34290 RepID=A0A7J8WXS9_GOSAI|nr:hypothetical protein [Gossypium aridum]
MEVISAPIHENQEWKLWLAETFNINNTYQCTCLAVSFWAIWHNRSKFFYEGIRQRICDIVGFIKAYITELSILDEELESKHNRKEAH